MAQEKNLKECVRGNVIWILILVALLHIVYPITTVGASYLITYQVAYGLMCAAGIYISRQTKRPLIVASVSALLFLTFGIAYAFDPLSGHKILATYLPLIPFHITIIYVLLRFIFTARTVDRDVLYAAITIYLLIGALFVPIYGIMEILDPGSFADGTVTQIPYPWQRLVYYSYATLTTLGYGDITPTSMWAGAFASMEAIVGVLYIAILMARLVGLYAREKI